MKSSSGDEDQQLGVTASNGPATGSGRSAQAAAADGHHGWRFVTNHARVLETIARDPTTRLRDIALVVGLTERTAAQIVNDFVQAGYLTKTREGRRNRYEVHGDLPLRDPLHSHRTIGQLLAFLQGPAPAASDTEPWSSDTGRGPRGS
jgi:hypothetical protein